METKGIRDLIKRSLPLDVVYALIRINSDKLRSDSDKSDEDTLSRELIDYVDNNKYAKLEVADLVMKVILPKKALLHFIDHRYFSLYEIISEDGSYKYRIIDKIVLDYTDKDIIQRVLDNNFLEKKCFHDEYNRTTDVVRLNVNVGNYEEAIKEFDGIRGFFGPNDVKTLYKEPSFFDRTNDELYLLLRDVLNSSFTTEEKRKFTDHVVSSDSVKLISTNALALVKDLLGNEQFDYFMIYFMDEVSKSRKALFTYNQGIEPFAYNDLRGIRVANISEVNFREDKSDIRTSVKDGEFDKAIEAFDNKDSFGYNGEEHTDELYLLLKDVLEYVKDPQKQHLFTQAIVYSDNIRMVSISSLSLISELLGEEYEHYVDYLLSEVDNNKKAIYDYDVEDSKDGIDIHDINIVDVNSTRQFVKKKNEN